MKNLEQNFTNLILEVDRQAMLLEILEDLARAADTAELLLRKDFPGEAGSLRKKVADVRYFLSK